MLKTVKTTRMRIHSSGFQTSTEFFFFFLKITFLQVKYKLNTTKTLKNTHNTVGATAACCQLLMWRIPLFMLLGLEASYLSSWWCCDFLLYWSLQQTVQRVDLCRVLRLIREDRLWGRSLLCVLASRWIVLAVTLGTRGRWFGDAVNGVNFLTFPGELILSWDAALSGMTDINILIRSVATRRCRGPGLRLCLLL